MHGGRFKSRKKWGLPGGHVERNEDGVETVRRELREELYLQSSDIHTDDYLMLGDYYYRQNHHRIYGADIAQPIARYDKRGLTKIAWFPIDSIQQIARDGNLHAGYEVDAVLRYRDLSTERR